MTFLKKNIYGIVALFYTLALFTLPVLPLFSLTSAFAEEELSARQIAQETFDRNRGDNSRASALMVLVDKKGDKRTRKLEALRIKQGDLENQIIRFLSPADIRGTGFLTIEKEGWDTDQFLYLPALRRTRRIVASQKSHSFVNSDFSYEDMERNPVDNYSYTMEGTSTINNLPCYVISSQPKKGIESQYTTVKSHITKGFFVPLLTEFFNDKGKMIKQYKVMKLEKIQNIWTESTVMMETLKTKHKTYIKIQNIEYNTDINTEALSKEALESF